MKDDNVPKHKELCTGVAEKKESQEKKAAEYFNEVCDQMGVAVSTVKDGVVLSFKREWLQDLLNKYPDKEKIVLFIQQKEFKN